MFDAILVDGAIFLKASLHGIKKAGGGGGSGGGQPPSFANTFITSSDGVRMGFGFVARMIAAAILHSLQITRGC